MTNMFGAAIVCIVTIAACGSDTGASPSPDAPPVANGCDVTTSPPADTLQLVTADGSACLRIDRTEMCDGGICKAIPYRVDRVVYDIHQVRGETTDPANTWVPTHHNWYDTATFIDGDTRIELAMLFDINTALIDYEIILQQGNASPIAVTMRPRD